MKKVLIKEEMDRCGIKHKFIQEKLGIHRVTFSILVNNEHLIDDIREMLEI